MNRINKKFEELKSKDKKALITYVTAGDPTLEVTEKIIYAKIKGGADIIEIGIPFSDPLADGPIIQAAALRSLENGTTLKKIFVMINKVRKNTDIPLVFLVYYNSILSYGLKRFVDDCNGIIDGLIIPDLPFEEIDEIRPFIDNKEVTLIPMLSPTSKDRIQKILSSYTKSGFIYCVTSLGVTGIDGVFHRDLIEYLNTVKRFSSLPVCAGFGVKNKEDFSKLSEIVDGVIIGSAIVKEINENGFEEEKLSTYISSFS